MDIHWIQNSRTTYEKYLFLSIIKYARNYQYIEGDDSYEVSHNVRRLIRVGELPILVDVPQDINPYDMGGIVEEIFKAREMGIAVPKFTILRITDVILLNPNAPPKKELIILEKILNNFADLLTRANGKLYQYTNTLTLPDKFFGRVIVTSDNLVDDTVTTLSHEAKTLGYHHALVIKKGVL